MYGGPNLCGRNSHSLTLAYTDTWAHAHIYMHTYMHMDASADVLRMVCDKNKLKADEYTLRHMDVKTEFDLRLTVEESQLNECCLVKKDRHSGACARVAVWGRAHVWNCSYPCAYAHACVCGSDCVCLLCLGGCIRVCVFD
jgi:hypothetical protein